MNTTTSLAISGKEEKYDGNEPSAVTFQTTGFSDAGHRRPAQVLEGKARINPTSIPRVTWQEGLGGLGPLHQFWIVSRKEQKADSSDPSPKQLQKHALEGLKRSQCHDSRHGSAGKPDVTPPILRL